MGLGAFRQRENAVGHALPRNMDISQISIHGSSSPGYTDWLQSAQRLATDLNPFGPSFSLSALLA